MLDFTNHLINASRGTTRYHTYQDGYYQKTRQLQVLMSMWRIWNSCGGGDVKYATAMWRTVCWCLRKLKIEFPLWPRDFIYEHIFKRTESRVWKKYRYISVHCSMDHNNWNVEETLMSISRWLDKQNTVYSYTGLLFIFKRKTTKRVLHVTTWMIHQVTMVSEINQLQNDT